MQYSVDDLVKVAKRDNNLIRPYLYVNPKQGKHIPANPEDITAICRELANIVNAAYPDELLYLIGFAETATGIAAAVGSFLDNVVYYQNTTRERCSGRDYLQFTESHSHAAEQTLRSAGIDECIKKVNRILFVDDEITTGSTICKLIDLIKKKYKISDMRYSMVSLLNSMTEERIGQLHDAGIDCLYLRRLPYEYKKDSIIDIEFESQRYTGFMKKPDIRNLAVEERDFISNRDPRSVLKFSDYDAEVERCAGEISAMLAGGRFEKVLVLGTEEFLYPTIEAGEMLRKEKIAENVKIHSTTRSPVIASGMKGYPLYHRYELRSLYDENRITYIYNLEKYDKVIIMTDADTDSPGIYDLWSALKNAGNRDITLIRWMNHKEL